MHLYIIRHGQTELNRLGIFQGRSVDAGLNETGWAQAEAFYKQYKNVPFDKIYVSTLKRTRQTVDRFIKRGTPWCQLSGLDEIEWGIWEGKLSTQKSSKVFKDLVKLWQAGSYDAAFEGGESPNQVLARLKSAFEIIINGKKEKQVLICMHGRAMRILLCHLSAKPLSEMEDFPHQNTTLYRIVSDDEGKFNIVDFNNTGHLVHIQTPKSLS